MEIRAGGGVFGLGNPVGRGGVTVIQEIWVGGGVKKPCHPLEGGVDFFWNSPISRADSDQMVESETLKGRRLQELSWIYEYLSTCRVNFDNLTLSAGTTLSDIYIKNRLQHLFK